MGGQERHAAQAVVRGGLRPPQRQCLIMKDVTALSMPLPDYTFGSAGQQIPSFSVANSSQLCFANASD